MCDVLRDKSGYIFNKKHYPAINYICHNLTIKCRHFSFINGHYMYLW
jgi:hypothetical protein